MDPIHRFSVRNARLGFFSAYLQNASLVWYWGGEGLTWTYPALKVSLLHEAKGS
jgi:hypothetical protein